MKNPLVAFVIIDFVIIFILKRTGIVDRILKVNKDSSKTKKNISDFVLFTIAFILAGLIILPFTNYFK